MMTEKRIKNWLGIILQGGILLSILFVLIGGAGFLWEHGQDSFQSNLISSTKYNMNLFSRQENDHLCSSLGLIELGLFILVFAQVVRVGLLGIYYIYIRDYWFTAFSFFILSVILYSLIWQ